METVERDFAPKGVKFYYIYKSLAHPENNGYVAPFDLKERLMHVAEAKRTLGSRIEWICDTMENDLKHALGDRPNSEFVIDPEGKIVVSRSWSKPDQLREDLTKLVGAVDRPTRIADLQMKKQPAPQKAKTGVVRRVQLPGPMSPLKIEPLESDTPHYAKLRAESGKDKLYLGFFLDPLYKVHWNNKAPALEIAIEAPDGVTVTPDRATSPKVDVDADADPREFLVEVSGRSSDPLKVTVKYFACDDAETFCVPVTQQYRVSFERDRDGGSRRASGGNRGVARTRPAVRGGPGQNQNRASMITRMFNQNDRNGDGRLMGDEIPAPMRQRMAQMDSNGDGAISQTEMETMIRRRFGAAR